MKTYFHQVILENNKHMFIVVWLILLVNISFGQVFTQGISLKTRVFEGFYNDNSCKVVDYLDSNKTNNYFEIVIYKKMLLNISSIDSTKRNAIEMYNNNKIKFFIEFKNYQADGLLIWFNKRGTIELIAIYNNSKLKDVLFYRKRKKLNRYLKEYKSCIPVSFLEPIFINN